MEILTSPPIGSHVGGEYKCLTLEPVGLAHARTPRTAQLNADGNGPRRAFKSIIVKGLRRFPSRSSRSACLQMQRHLTRNKCLTGVRPPVTSAKASRAKKPRETLGRAAQGGWTEADEACGEKGPALSPSSSRPAAAPAESQSCCRNNRSIFPQFTEGRDGGGW